MCTYKQFEGPVKDKGNAVAYFRGITYEECIEECNKNEKCQSLVWNLWRQKSNNRCYLKDKKLTGTELLAEQNSAFFSVYKSCSTGIE